MSKFLNYGTGGITYEDITNGSLPIYANKLKLSNLLPNMPIKSDEKQNLYSTKLQATDVEGIITNPLNDILVVKDVETDDFFSINNQLQYINNFEDSTATTTNITGKVNITQQVIVPQITDTTETVRIELDDTNIGIVAQNLTFNGLDVLTSSNLQTLENKTFYISPVLSVDGTVFSNNIYADAYIKTGGTNEQYLMADGSSLQYSSNSGNSNFYLYNNGTDLNPTPANGYITYNNVVQDNATFIYISHRTRDTIDIEVFFKNLSSLNDVYIQDQENSENNITYNITGSPVIVNQAQVTIPVLKTTSNGTGSTSFGNGHNLLLSFFTNSIETDGRLTTLENKTRHVTSTSTRTILEKSSQMRLTSLDNFSVTLDVGLDVFPKFVVSGTQVNSYIPMSMNNNKLNGIPTPIDNDDATNKLYVDNATASKLDISGGTMFGSLSMFNNILNGIPTPLNNNDATNKLYVDNANNLKLNAVPSLIQQGGLKWAKVNAAVSQGGSVGVFDLIGTPLNNAIIGSTTFAAGEITPFSTYVITVCGRITLPSNSGTTVRITMNGTAVDPVSFGNHPAVSGGVFNCITTWTFRNGGLFSASIVNNLGNATQASTSISGGGGSNNLNVNIQQIMGVEFSSPTFTTPSITTYTITCVKL